MPSFSIRPWYYAGDVILSVSSLSTHNKSVKEKMMDELIKTPDLKYSEEQVKSK